MAEIYNKIKNVDIDKDEIIKLNAMEGDTARLITFRFFQNNKLIDLTGYKVRINAINSKYNVIFNDLNIIDHKKGLAQLELDNNFLQPGVTEYQLIIMNDRKELKSRIMELNVNKRMNNDEKIASCNDFTAFKNALATIDKYDLRLEKDENTIAENKNITDKSIEDLIDKLKTKEQELTKLIDDAKKSLSSEIKETDDNLNQFKNKFSVYASGTKGYEEFPTSDGKTWVHEFGWYNTVSKGGVKMDRIGEIINCSATPSSTVQGTCSVYTEDQNILRFVHNFSDTIYIYWHAWGYKKEGKE